MLCPKCYSSKVNGPQYAQSQAGKAAIMTCTICDNRFDAYQAYGQSRTRTNFYISAAA
jgi:hypothetical protein